MWIGLQEGRATITALHHCTNAVMHTCYAECINTALDKAEKVQCKYDKNTMDREERADKEWWKIGAEMGIGGPVVLGRLGWWLVSARPRRIGQVGPSTCGCQSVSFKSALAKDQDEGDRPPPGWISSLYLHFYLLLLTLLTLFHYIKNLESSYVSWCFLLSDQNSQLP